MPLDEHDSSHDEPVSIEFVGELNIRSIVEAHGRLTKLMAASSAVVADVAPDASVDLTFIQLLESARRTAREASGSFRLARPADGALLETLERGGFLAAPADRDFWLMQAEVR
jgi:hypothetical protein